MGLKPLSYRSFPRANESYHGYLERLARDNGFNNALEMIKSFRAQGMQKWEAPTDVLRVLTGHPNHQLEKIGLIRPEAGNRHNFHLFGERIPAWWLRLIKACYICPLCIEELGFIKLIWQFSWISTCPSHRISLINTCSECHKEINFTTAIRSRCLCRANFVAPPEKNWRQIEFDMEAEACISSRKVPVVTRATRQIENLDGSLHYMSGLTIDGRWLW